MERESVSEIGRCRQLQSSLVEAMKRPSFYPKPPADIVYREPPLSHLFFAGEVVFKIKKPVHCAVLHCSTLTRRRHLLVEELR